MISMLLFELLFLYRESFERPCDQVLFIVRVSVLCFWLPLLHFWYLLYLEVFVAQLYSSLTFLKDSQSGFTYVLIALACRLLLLYSNTIYFRFDIKDGNVTYMCKFLETESYKKNFENNRIVASAFGTATAPDPCISIFRRLVVVLVFFFFCKNIIAI